MFKVKSFSSLLRRIAVCTQAGVSTIATLALPVVVGTAGLAFDMNRGYQQRIINQRAADMGALGAAMAYQDSSNAAILQPTAQDIAIANGLAGATVGATLVADMPAAGDQAVQVTVSNALPFALARVLGFSGTYNVRAESFASLTGGTTYAAPCYLALDGGKAAISVTGGASISAPTCSIAAIGEVENKGTLIHGADIISGSDGIYVNHGTLTANSLRFATTFSKPQWNNNVPASDKWINQATALSDPWANDPDRVAAMALLGNYTALPTLSDPVTPTGDTYDFDWSPSARTSGFRVGSTAVYNVPAGNYTIKKLEVAGGITVNFANGSNITVSQGVAIGGGSTVNFGNANLYVNGGFDSGSSGVTIGNGVLWIGSGQVKWQGTNTKGTGDVTINATLSLGGGQHLRMGAGNHKFKSIDVGGGGTALLGAGDLTVTDGVTVGGDSELAMAGNGAINIGPGNGGRAIKLNGSARFIMGDGTFSANGDIDTVGGSKIIFGQTANHYINGKLNIAGAAFFGAGRYTVDGDFENGTGGTVFPYTSTLTGLTYGDAVAGESGAGYDMFGVNVTFILSGTMKLAGGAKTKLLAASTTQSGGHIAELLLSTHSSADANWTGGSLNMFSGALHLPNGQVKMAGGNGTHSIRCMTLIADTIRVNGGAATGTACDKMDGLVGGGGSTTIRLIG